MVIGRWPQGGGVLSLVILKDCEVIRKGSGMGSGSRIVVHLNRLLAVVSASSMHRY
jgi:hypothetical protein